MENDISNQKEISNSDILIDEINNVGLNSKPNGENAFIEFQKHIGIEIGNEAKNISLKKDVVSEETSKKDQMVATTYKNESSTNMSLSEKVSNDLDNDQNAKFKADKTEDTNRDIEKLSNNSIEKHEQGNDNSDKAIKEASMHPTTSVMDVTTSIVQASIQKSSKTHFKTDKKPVVNIHKSPKMSETPIKRIENKPPKVVLRQHENMMVYLNDVPHKSRSHNDDNATRNNAFLLSKNIEILKKKSVELEWTALDANKDFMFIGASTGALYIFDRNYGVLKKTLFSRDNPHKITRVKLIDESKCLVAIGNTHGLVSVFHFHVREDIAHKMSVYMIENMHETEISSLEWGGGGKVLFSGDTKGLVVLTELNWSMNNSRSRVVKKETSPIVQLSHHFPCILISTLDHTIIYNLLQCKTFTVGQLERKKPGPYGATFDVEKDMTENIKTHPNNENNDEKNNEIDETKILTENKDTGEDKNVEDKRDLRAVRILACRQNMRLWQADVSGVVHFTYVFKNQIKTPSKNIYLLNLDESGIAQNDVFGAYQFYNIYPFVVRECSGGQSNEYDSGINTSDGVNGGFGGVNGGTMHESSNQSEERNCLEHMITNGVVTNESDELKKTFEASNNDEVTNPAIHSNGSSSCDDNTTSNPDMRISYGDGILMSDRLLDVNDSNLKITSSGKSDIDENKLYNKEKNELSKDEEKQANIAHVKSILDNNQQKMLNRTKKYYVTHDSKTVYLLDLESSTIECHYTFECRIVDVVVDNDAEEILVLLEENTINRNKSINAHDKHSQNVDYKETSQFIEDKMRNDLVKDNCYDFQPLIRLSTKKMPPFLAKPITNHMTSNGPLNKISKMAAEWTNLAGVVKEESLNVAKKIATTSTTVAKQLNKINYEVYTKNINSKVVNFTSNIASSIIKEDRREWDKESDKFETSSMGSSRDDSSVSGIYKSSYLFKETDTISRGSFNDDKKDIISIHTYSASADGDNDNGSDKLEDNMDLGQFDLNEPIVFETKRLVRKRRIKKAGRNEKKKATKGKGETDLESDLHPKPSYGIDLNLLKGNEDAISEDIIFADFIKKYGFPKEIKNNNSNKNSSDTSLNVRFLQKDNDNNGFNIPKSNSYNDLNDPRALKKSLKGSIENIKLDCNHLTHTHTINKNESLGSIFKNNNNNKLNRSRSLSDDLNIEFLILKDTGWKSYNNMMNSNTGFKDNSIKIENKKIKINIGNENNKKLESSLDNLKNPSIEAEKKNVLTEAPRSNELQVSMKEDDFLLVDYAQTYKKDENEHKNLFEEDDEENDWYDSIPYEDMFSHLLTKNNEENDEIGRNNTNKEINENIDEFNDSKFNNTQNDSSFVSNQVGIHNNKNGTQPEENAFDLIEGSQETTMKDNCDLKTLSENIQKSIDEISYNNIMGNTSQKELLQEFIKFSKDQKQGLKDMKQRSKTATSITQKEPLKNTAVLPDTNSPPIKQHTPSEPQLDSNIPSPKSVKLHRIQVSSSSSLCITNKHMWIVLNKNLYRANYANGKISSTTPTSIHAKDIRIDNTTNFNNNEDENRVLNIEDYTDKNQSSNNIDSNGGTLAWKMITSNVDCVAVSPNEVNIWVLRSVASLSSSLLWFSSSSSSSSVLLVLCRRLVKSKNSEKEVKLEWREGGSDVDYITMPTDSLAFIIKRNGDLFYQTNLDSNHSYTKSIKIDLGFPIKRLVYQNDIVWVLRADHQLNAFTMDGGIVHLQYIFSTPVNVYHSIGVQSYHLHSNGCAWVVLRNRDVMFCEGVTKKNPGGNGLWYKVPLTLKHSKDGMNVLDKEVEESLVIRGDSNSIWIHHKPMGIIWQLSNYSIGYRFESKCMLNSNGTPFPPLFSHFCINKGTAWLVQRLGQLCSLDLTSSSSSSSSPSSLTSSLSSSSSHKSKSKKLEPDSHPLAASFSPSSSLTSSASMSNFSTSVPVLTVPSILLTSPFTHTSTSRAKKDFVSAFKNKIVFVANQALMAPLMLKDGSNVESHNNQKNNNYYFGEDNTKVSKRDTQHKKSYLFTGVNTQNCSQQEYLRIFLVPTSANKITTISSTPRSLWCLYDNGEVSTLIIKNKSKHKDDFEDSSSSFEESEGRFVNVNMSQLSSELVHLSSGSKSVWACDKLGQVHMRIGSKVKSEEHGLSAVWLPLRTSFTAELEPIRFKRVYVSPDCCIVWGVDFENNLYARFGIDLSYSIGTHWILVEGIKCSFMAMGHRCVVVGTENGDVYLREGVTKSEPSGTSWAFLFNSTVENFCSSACNSDNDFWFLDRNGLIHHLILHRTFHLPS